MKRKPRIPRDLQNELNRQQRRLLKRNSISLAARQSLALIISTLLCAIISGQLLGPSFLQITVGYLALTSLILSAIVCLAYHLQLHSLRIGSRQDANDAVSDLRWVWSLGLRLAGLGIIFLVFLLSLTAYSQLGPNSFVAKAAMGMILGSASLVLVVIARVPYVTPNTYCRHVVARNPRT